MPGPVRGAIAIVVVPRRTCCRSIRVKLYVTKKKLSAIMAGGPFKPFFVSGHVPGVSSTHALGTETISRVRSDSVCGLLLLPSSSRERPRDSALPQSPPLKPKNGLNGPPANHRVVSEKSPPHSLSKSQNV
jgi:hypothetical protein